MKRIGDYTPNSSALGVLGLLAAILGVLVMAGIAGTVQAEQVGTFKYRAPINPYSIDQPPDFMMHSRAETDIIMQRGGPPKVGAGGWHTHSGPSFILIEKGKVKIERFTKKGGCTETKVHGPGSVFLQVADQVHRAVAIEAPVVRLAIRFNIPVGGGISIPAEDPGC